MPGRKKQTIMADFTRSPADGDIVQERVQQLTWALLDENITEDELSLLENLLLSDDRARATYIGCVQLHSNLAAHFAVERPTADALPAKSPVLQFLNELMPPLGFQSPAEDANR
jgi:hypothetical protein